MTVYLTHLPEDPFHEWRVHGDTADEWANTWRGRDLHLTGEEMEDLVRQYNMVVASRDERWAEALERFGARLKEEQEILLRKIEELNGR